MKKLLSLLSAVAITASTSVTAVACGTTPPPATPDQKAVNAIINKINTNNEISVLFNISTDTSNDDTITALRHGIEVANPKSTFKPNELKDITFAKATLVDGKITKLKTTITVNKAFSSIELSATHQTAQESINSIKARTQKTDITIPLETNISSKNEGTIATLKKYLQKANPLLSDADVNTMSFDNSITFNNQEMKGVSLPLIIKVGSLTDNTIKLSVTINNWVKVKGLGNTNVAPVYIDGTYFLATSTNGLWTSSDGVTWTKNSDSHLVGATFHSSPVHFGGDENYYLASANKGLLVSVDKGVSWANVSDPSRTLDDAKILVAPVLIGDYYYVTTKKSGLWRRKQKSETVWKKCSGLTDATTMYSAPTRPGGEEGDNLYYLATGETKTGQSTPSGLYSSEDGYTWTQTPKHDFKGIILYDSPNKINSTYFLTTFGSGFYTSTDGKNWTQNQSPGLPDATGETPITEIDDIYYFATYGQGLWTSTDPTGTWTQNQTIGSSTKFYGKPVKIDDVIYLASYDGGLWTSSDKGVSWVQTETKGLKDAQFHIAPVKIKDQYFITTGTVGMWTMKVLPV